MASSDLSKSTGQLGVASTTYVCPKIAGSVASGVVFLGVFVLMLIPRPDHGSPVIDEAALNSSPEPEIALSTPSPRNDSPEVTTPTAPTVPKAVEPEPEPAKPQQPAEREAVEPKPEPEPAKVQQPAEREHVIKVLHGEFARPLRGDEFVLRGTDEGTVQIKLAAVSAPVSGVGRNRAAGALRDLMRGPVSVQCIEQVDKRDWIGWVYSQGTEVNERMIAQGFAFYDPRMIKSVTLRELQEKARSAGLGVWKGGNTEPIYPEELQAIGTEDATQQETNDASEESEATADEANSDAVSTAGESTSSEEAGSEVSAPAEVPKEPITSTPPDSATNPVIVDRSTPEKLIASFTAALHQDDLETARSLLSTRTWGRASLFQEGRLSSSGIDNLRVAFDGATIRDVRQLSRKWNVLMETSTGKKMQVLVEHDGSGWLIYSWDVPR